MEEKEIFDYLKTMNDRQLLMLIIGNKISKDQAFKKTLLLAARKTK